MNLQVASNAAALFPSQRVRSLGTLGKGNRPVASEASMNYARKWHEPGSKMVQTRIENGTNQARKWHEQGSKMARTGQEKSTNQAQKPVRKILQFVSFRLEAGYAKWLEPRRDRRINLTQMTGNSVRKALWFLWEPI